MIRVGIDMDGVLANWNAQYLMALRDASGINRTGTTFEEDHPPVWDWPLHFGYTREQCERAYEATQTTDFWRFLSPLPGVREFLVALSNLIAENKVEAYFITSRSGPRVKEQTEDWLIAHGLFERPTVLISKNPKGGACWTLGLDAFIDDKWENCLDAKDGGVPLVFLQARPYNLSQHVARHEDIVRGDLVEFLYALQDNS